MHRYNTDDVPPRYLSEVVAPVRIERHVDASARACKTLGFDQGGRRCYYRHVFTLSEQRFDAEEFPLEVDVYEEDVQAWRLADGTWLRIKNSSDQLDHCRKRVVCQAAEITWAAALEA